MRTCIKCGAADNPLGKLRFKKYLDGDIYCDRCHPGRIAEVPPALSGLEITSAGSPSTGELVVMACPDCAGGMHRPHGKPCQGCMGLGSVRYPASALVVYTPKVTVEAEPAPELLLEG